MASWRFFLNGLEVEEPIGWDSIEFTANRTQEHGVDQPFSTEVSFYGKGAKYLKDVYDQYFINAEVQIKIISDVYVEGVPYEFDGYINMSLYSERNVCDTDSWEVSVGIMDDNFREKFKSRMDVDLDVYAPKDLDGNPISAVSFESIRMHTQEVYLVGYAKSIAQTYPISTWATLLWTYDDGWIAEDFAAVIPAYFNNSDFEGAFGNTFDPVQPKWSPSNVCFKNNSTFTRTLKFSVRVKGAFEWNVPNGKPGETASVALLVGVFNGDSPNKGSMVYEQGLGESAVQAFNSGAVTTFDLSGQVSATLQPDWRVSIYVQWGGSGNVYPGSDLDAVIGRELNLWIDDVCLTITENNSAEYASFSEMMRVENFLSRMVYIITGNQNGFVSDTFSKANNGCYWNYALTNGLKIRNAKTNASSGEICDPNALLTQTNFQVSFKKVFESLSAIFCLGWGFEKDTNGNWQVRVESVEYFYQNQIEFTALNVGQVRRSAQTEDLANQFVMGYDDTWKNIQAAGIWAIHTNRTYYVDNRAMAEGTTKKMELLSSIIAEGYAIEFSRRMYFFQPDSGSSDRPNDYELFIIWLNRTSLVVPNVQNSEYRLPPPETGTATFPPGSVSMSSRRGAISYSEVGDLYNIAITPARNAMRWWKVLGMHTYGLTNPKLKFQTGQYQKDYKSNVFSQHAACKMEAGDVIESMDIEPSALSILYQQYLFKPIEIDFEYPQSLCEFINLSDLNPYGKVKLTSGSLSVSGYITSIKNKPEDSNGGTTSFLLLASNIPDIEPPEPPGGRAYSNAYSNAYQ
jgi:hypothetical protein